MLKSVSILFASVVILFTALGCKEDAGAPGAVESELYKKGKIVYISRCIACHSSDPKKDGPLGPAVWGSSKELLEARVLRAEYPAGYTAKRNTKMMLAMPELAPEIDALHEYLNK